MDKNVIRSFAVESRRKMIESVRYQASLIGITANGISEPISTGEGMETYDYGAGSYTIYDEDIKKRESLVKEVNNKGFDTVVEEVAYTWFNRIIAIRYMEVNDYLPTRTRVLSSEDEVKTEPDIVTEALNLNLNFSEEDRQKILKYEEENNDDKLFQFLFIKQCNKLNEILPRLFVKTDDYMELLIDIKFTDENSVVRQLINTIPEEDFGNQVEIIGWLYQFYNSELKDETFTNLKKKIKIGEKQIPPATQIFTPDWIVKYMVENSLGKLWIESHPNEELKSSWKYYIPNVNQDSEVESQLVNMKHEVNEITPQDIKIIDPCMGSGHILVYVFDVLMQIYLSEGYTVNDSVISILENNLYGLDIDDRAYQLSYFAIMMKAREYNKDVFNKEIKPQVYSLTDSKLISKNTLKSLTLENPDIEIDLVNLINSFNNVKLVGSLLSIENINIGNIENTVLSLKNKQFINLDIANTNELELLLDIINQYKILSEKYDAVITNPPYMGSRSMDKRLSDFLKENYPSTKSDLSTVFMEKSFALSKEYGFIAMINIPVWMFISSYEKLRNYILEYSTIINLIDMGRGVFGSDFGTVAFVINNFYLDNFKGIYRKLYEKKVAVDTVEKKEVLFLDENYNKYSLNQNKFKQIPGMPIAYWVTNNIIDCFSIGEDITKYIDTFQGIITGNNNKFLRYWYEISSENLALNKESMDDIDLNQTYWIPYNKGGKFRKWYGNQDYVVNWKNGPHDKTRGKAQFSDFYLRDSVSWSYIAFATLATRYYPKGFLWDVHGSGLFDKEDNLFYIQALLTSKVGMAILKVINSSLSFQVENILQVPIIFDESKKEEIDILVEQNIEISKKDWDSFETSWNFLKHPFLKFRNNLLSDNFNEWKHSQQIFIDKVLNNENRLNEIFINIYNLKNELDPETEVKDITIYNPVLNNDVKSFISYAVGCMFGRYSLDEEGLQFSGGKFDINNYSKFIPDDDNIIPILDTAYFGDDIVGRFEEFIKICFGDETLEENLDFIAEALNKKGKTSREVIRNYFLTDFYKDHIQTYKKYPIYWQFDSGKQNAFKCLIYMHRYDSSIVARVRTDYLHKTQKAIEQNLADCEDTIANSSNKSEIAKATKDRTKCLKQLDEIRVYDEALGHIANQRIEIDLDDGVKVNHSKFQKIEISKEGEKTKKVDLLKKI